MESKERPNKAGIAIAVTAFALSIGLTILILRLHSKIALHLIERFLSVVIYTLGAALQTLFVIVSYQSSRRTFTKTGKRGSFNDRFIFWCLTITAVFLILLAYDAWVQLVRDLKR